MPWKVFKRDGKYQLFKLDSAGEPTGDALGTHDSEDDAKRQQRALYASEAKAVKFVDEAAGELEGCLMPFGGPFNGRDLDGQFFSKKTDFCLDWFPGDRPLLYHHGLDEDAGVSPIGRIKAIEMREDGGWMRGQLDKQSKYFAAIRKMVKDGQLYLSSGAMAHLVQVDTKSGEILRWPLVEGTTTPTPSNLLATVKLADAAKHFKAANLDPAPLKAMSEKQMRSMASGMADEMDVEMSDEDMAQMMASLDAEMPEDELRTVIHKKMQARKREMMGEKAAGLFALLLDDDPAIDTALAGLPITTHAEVTAKYAATLAQRTKDLRERRIKEGRVLSGTNRQRIRECMDVMDGAMTALRDLYDSTEPQPAKAASVRRVRAQIAALRIQALGLS